MSRAGPHTILFTLPKLQVGGAERELLELVRGLDKTRYRAIVAPLSEGGALHDEFAQIPGVDVVDDLVRAGKWDVSILWRAVSSFRRHGVAIVQPYMVPSTVFGLLAGRLAGLRGIVLTERSGARNESNLYLRLQDRLTWLASVVVANSEAGRTSLRKRGIACSRIKVIENGINLRQLTANPKAVEVHRRQLLGPDGSHLVGIVAGLRPVKQHEMFLRAAEQLSCELPSIRFVVVGDGPRRVELVRMAAELGLADRIVLLGSLFPTTDLVAALRRAGFHILRRRAFKLRLEAMALSVPVIATDIPAHTRGRS